MSTKKSSGKLIPVKGEAPLQIFMVELWRSKEPGKFDVKFRFAPGLPNIKTNEDFENLTTAQKKVAEYAQVMGEYINAKNGGPK